MNSCWLCGSHYVGWNGFVTFRTFTHWRSRLTRSIRINRRQIDTHIDRQTDRQTDKPGKTWQTSRAGCECLRLDWAIWPAAWRERVGKSWSAWWSCYLAAAYTRHETLQLIRLTLSDAISLSFLQYNNCVYCLTSSILLCKCPLQSSVDGYCKTHFRKGNNFNTLSQLSLHAESNVEILSLKQTTKE